MDDHRELMGAMAELGVDKVWVSNRVEDPPSWAAEVCEATVAPLADLGRAA